MSRFDDLISASNRLLNSTPNNTPEPGYYDNPTLRNIQKKAEGFVTGLVGGIAKSVSEFFSSEDIKVTDPTVSKVNSKTPFTVSQWTNGVVNVKYDNSNVSDLQKIYDIQDQLKKNPNYKDPLKNVDPTNLFKNYDKAKKKFSSLDSWDGILSGIWDWAKTTFAELFWGLWAWLSATQNSPEFSIGKDSNNNIIITTPEGNHRANTAWEASIFSNLDKAEASLALWKKSNPELYTSLSVDDKKKVDEAIASLDKDTYRSASVFTTATELMWVPTVRDRDFNVENEKGAQFRKYIENYIKAVNPKQNITPNDVTNVLKENSEYSTMLKSFESNDPKLDRAIQAAIDNAVIIKEQGHPNWRWLAMTHANDGIIATELSDFKYKNRAAWYREAAWLLENLWYGLSSLAEGMVGATAAIVDNTLIHSDFGIDTIYGYKYLKYADVDEKTKAVAWASEVASSIAEFGIDMFITHNVANMLKAVTSYKKFMNVFKKYPKIYSALKKIEGPMSYLDEWKDTIGNQTFRKTFVQSTKREALENAAGALVFNNEDNPYTPEDLAIDVVTSWVAILKDIVRLKKVNDPLKIGQAFVNTYMDPNKWKLVSAWMKIAIGDKILKTVDWDPAETRYIDSILTEFQAQKQGKRKIQTVSSMLGREMSKAIDKNVDDMLYHMTSIDPNVAKYFDESWKFIWTKKQKDQLIKNISSYAVDIKSTDWLKRVNGFFDEYIKNNIKELSKNEAYSHFIEKKDLKGLRDFMIQESPIIAKMIHRTELSALQSETNKTFRQKMSFVKDLFIEHNKKVLTSKADADYIYFRKELFSNTTVDSLFKDFAKKEFKIDVDSVTDLDKKTFLKIARQFNARRDDALRNQALLEEAKLFKIDLNNPEKFILGKDFVEATKMNKNLIDLGMEGYLKLVSNKLLSPLEKESILRAYWQYEAPTKPVGRVSSIAEFKMRAWGVWEIVSTNHNIRYFSTGYSSDWSFNYVLAKGKKKIGSIKVYKDGLYIVDYKPLGGRTSWAEIKFSPWENMIWTINSKDIPIIDSSSSTITEADIIKWGDSAKEFSLNMWTNLFSASDTWDYKRAIAILGNIFPDKNIPEDFVKSLLKQDSTPKQKMTTIISMMLNERVQINTDWYITLKLSSKTGLGLDLGLEKWDPFVYSVLDIIKKSDDGLFIFPNKDMLSLKDGVLYDGSTPVGKYEITDNDLLISFDANHSRYEWEVVYTKKENIDPDTIHTLDAPQHIPEKKHAQPKLIETKDDNVLEVQPKKETIVSKWLTPATPQPTKLALPLKRGWKHVASDSVQWVPADKFESLSSAINYAKENNLMLTYDNNKSVYYFLRSPLQTGKEWTVGLTDAEKKYVARSAWPKEWLDYFWLRTLNDLDPITKDYYWVPTNHVFSSMKDEMTKKVLKNMFWSDIDPLSFMSDFFLGKWYKPESLAKTVSDIIRAKKSWRMTRWIQNGWVEARKDWRVSGIKDMPEGYVVYETELSKRLWLKPTHKYDNPDKFEVVSPTSTTPTPFEKLDTLKLSSHSADWDGYVYSIINKYPVKIEWVEYKSFDEAYKSLNWSWAKEKYGESRLKEVGLEPFDTDTILKYYLTREALNQNPDLVKEFAETPLPILVKWNDTTLWMVYNSKTKKYEWENILWELITNEKNKLRSETIKQLYYSDSINEDEAAKAVIKDADLYPGLEYTPGVKKILVDIYERWDKALSFSTEQEIRAYERLKNLNPSRYRAIPKIWDKLSFKEYTAIKINEQFPFFDPYNIKARWESLIQIPMDKVNKYRELKSMIDSWFPLPAHSPIQDDFEKKDWSTLLEKNSLFMDQSDLPKSVSEIDDFIKRFGKSELQRKNIESFLSIYRPALERHELLQTLNDLDALSRWEFTEMLQESGTFSTKLRSTWKDSHVLERILAHIEERSGLSFKFFDPEKQKFVLRKQTAQETVSLKKSISKLLKNATISDRSVVEFKDLQTLVFLNKDVSLQDIGTTWFHYTVDEFWDNDTVVVLETINKQYKKEIEKFAKKNGFEWKPLDITKDWLAYKFVDYLNWRLESEGLIKGFFKRLWNIISAVFSDKNMTELFNNIYEGKMTRLKNIENVKPNSPKLYEHKWVTLLPMDSYIEDIYPQLKNVEAPKWGGYIENYQIPRQWEVFVAAEYKFKDWYSTKYIRRYAAPKNVDKGEVVRRLYWIARKIDDPSRFPVDLFKLNGYNTAEFMDAIREWNIESFIPFIRTEAYDKYAYLTKLDVSDYNKNNALNMLYDAVNLHKKLSTLKGVIVPEGYGIPGVRNQTFVSDPSYIKVLPRTHVQAKDWKIYIVRYTDSSERLEGNLDSFPSSVYVTNDPAKRIKEVGMPSKVFVKELSPEEVETMFTIHGDGETIYRNIAFILAMYQDEWLYKKYLKWSDWESFRDSVYTEYLKPLKEWDAINLKYLVNDPKYFENGDSAPYVKEFFKLKENDKAARNAVAQLLPMGNDWSLTWLWYGSKTRAHSIQSFWWEKPKINLDDILNKSIDVSKLIKSDSVEVNLKRARAMVKQYLISNPGVLKTKMTEEVLDAIMYDYLSKSSYNVDKKYIEGLYNGKIDDTRKEVVFDWDASEWQIHINDLWWEYKQVKADTLIKKFEWVEYDSLQVAGQRLAQRLGLKDYVPYKEKITKVLDERRAEIKRIESEIAKLEEENPWLKMFNALNQKIEEQLMDVFFKEKWGHYLSSQYRKENPEDYEEMLKQWESSKDLILSRALDWIQDSEFWDPQEFFKKDKYINRLTWEPFKELPEKSVYDKNMENSLEDYLSEEAKYREYSEDEELDESRWMFWYADELIEEIWKTDVERSAEEQMYAAIYKRSFLSRKLKTASPKDISKIEREIAELNVVVNNLVSEHWNDLYARVSGEVASDIRAWKTLNPSTVWNTLLPYAWRVDYSKWSNIKIWDQNISSAKQFFSETTDTARLVEREFVWDPEDWTIVPVDSISPDLPETLARHNKWVIFTTSKKTAEELKKDISEILDKANAINTLDSLSEEKKENILKKIIKDKWPLIKKMMGIEMSDEYKWVLLSEGVYEWRVRKALSEYITNMEREAWNTKWFQRADAIFTANSKYKDTKKFKSDIERLMYEQGKNIYIMKYSNWEITESLLKKDWSLNQLILKSIKSSMSVEQMYIKRAIELARDSASKDEFGVVSRYLNSSQSLKDKNSNVIYRRSHAFNWIKKNYPEEFKKAIDKEWFEKDKTIRLSIDSLWDIIVKRAKETGEYDSAIRNEAYRIIPELLEKDLKKFTDGMSQKESVDFYVKTNKDALYREFWSEYITTPKSSYITYSRSDWRVIYYKKQIKKWERVEVTDANIISDIAWSLLDDC